MTPLVPVAALADGDKAAFRVDGTEILLCRVDGRFHAVAGRCPHAGQALAGGRLDGHRLGCPLHGAAFDVRDGACLRGPAEVGLVTYPVMVNGGKVHVAVDRPRPPR